MVQFPLTIRCGEKTCQHESGECAFLRARDASTWMCHIFGVSMREDKDGNALRCLDCRKMQEGGNERR